MTETEITLFKELIRETVRSVLKEEKLQMAEEVKKSFAKDLKEIKLLIAKQIKENRERPQIIEQKDTPKSGGPALSETRATALRNILSGMQDGSGPRGPIRPPSVIQNIKENKSLDSMTKNILAQTAMTMAYEEEDIQEPTTSEYYPDGDVEEPYEPKFSGGMPSL